MEHALTEIVHETGSMLPTILAIISIALPFVGFLIIGICGKIAKKWAPILGTVTIGLSMLISFVVLYLTIKAGSPSQELSFTWLQAGNYVLDFGFRVDQLSAVMLVVVTVVSFLVHLFSVDYMHGDTGIARYYAELQMFTTAMLGVVTATNLAQLFFFWELVGLCSYLLIGFWFHKRSAYQAAKKAFFVTKIGDVGLFIGMLMIFVIGDVNGVHTLNFAQLPAAVKSIALVAPALVTIIPICIFAGAVGKSAQFPLHVWLPNAMEGPTPVSALIHAATMVAAGIFLTARIMDLFVLDLSGTALIVVRMFGAFTAFFAATIATVQDDIKKVLAYSTISQLGYMIMSLGVFHHSHGALIPIGYTPALFHLMTHAFFKANLFLGSGSVIHATHTQNMHEMGGLYKKMPITGLTFVIASLALAGLFPLAGFWSKDAILTSLANTLSDGWVSWVPFILALCAAFLTPYYMTRCVWLTFFGKPRKPNHAHEATWKTTFPLIFLAVLSVLVGFVGAPFFGELFQRFVFFHEFEHEVVNWTIIFGSTGIIFAAVFLGLAIYAFGWLKREKLIRAFKPVYLFLKNKWFIDEAWTFIAIKPLFWISKLALWIDVHIIDGMVNGAAWLAGKLGQGIYWFDSNVVDGLVNFMGWITVQASNLVKWFDENVVDGLVNSLAHTFGFFGKYTRKMQTGFVSNYAAIMFVSIAIALIAVAIFIF